MSNPIVAVADTIFPNLDPVKQELLRIDAELKFAEQPTPEAILAVAREADGLFVTYGQITADIIGELENCKVIGRFGIGTDNIDIPAATKRGIIVTYAPVYCLEEVSDHTMAMLMALARKIPFASNLVRAGRWEMPAVVPIHRLRGQTLGLVGLGNIPQSVAPKAQAFGISVISSDPFVSPEIAAKLNVELVSFDVLLERSDYVSLHAPLTPKTEKLLGADAFGKMKPSAFLINTARGPLVDVDALAKALDAGEIAGAALDVLPVEPPPEDLALLGRDNVIITPHTAFYSEEALLNLQTTVAKDVVAVLGGKTPAYPVNARELGRG
jgi:D-3-phosphoglycerate dehydrogenase